MIPGKLYLLVRKDLAPGAQAAQLVHAMRQFTHEHPDVDRVWFTGSNTVAVLSVRDETHLREVLHKAVSRGVKHSVFREPDFGDAATAAVLEPGIHSRRITSSLPLHG